MLIPASCLALLLLAGSAGAAPDDLEDTFQQLKDAESKRDAAQVRKLGAETYALAHKLAAAPAPTDDSEKDAWKERVTYARQIEVHTEYAIFATALQVPAAEKRDLLATLEQLNPSSKYLDQAYAAYFLALNQTGGAAKIPAIAEKAIANFPDNEDLLLVLADHAINDKQSARAQTYANRLIAVMDRHPKPEGISAADWERKRAAMLGRGYWIAGFVHSERNEYVEADKDLRAALPLIKGNDAMTAAALFYLGVANYQIGMLTANRVLVVEGSKFSDQAAAIPGPYAQQAWRNAQAMRTEALRMSGRSR